MTVMTAACNAICRASPAATGLPEEALARERPLQHGVHSHCCNSDLLKNTHYIRKRVEATCRSILRHPAGKNACMQQPALITSLASPDTGAYHPHDTLHSMCCT